MAGTVVDGAGKVVKGAHGLIVKSDKDGRDDEYNDYDAKTLESRRRGNISMLDRLNASKEGPVQPPPVELPTKNSPRMEKTMSKRRFSNGGRRPSMSNSLSTPTMLIPMTASSGKTGSSWDV